MTDFREEDVTISGAVNLGATVTYTDKGKKSPAVVLIMGTGKLDRDGNGTGMHMDFYRNLAAMFAEQGLVVLRYDKRGTHKSSGDFNSAGLSDFTDDAISVIQYAKALDYVDEDKVIVCGHSEGGIIATLLSQKEPTAGLIILGSAGQNLRDALHYQSRLVGEQSKEKKGITGAIMRRAATEEKVDANQDSLFDKCCATDKDTVFFKGVRISAKWIREHAAVSSEDLVNMLKSYGKPVLAITGTADLSSDYHALDPLRDAPGITCYSPENVNHILREIDDDNSITGVKKQYVRLAARPMHQGTKDTICDWLKQF